MRFLVVAHRHDKPAEAFAPYADAEAKQALRLYAEEKIRDIFSRADGKGAVLMVEAADEAEVRAMLATLPLAKADLLSFDIYALKPFRGIVAAAG